jgi:TM2 domain-containing membrane protein YozV
VFCRSCGKELTDSTTFCPSCGVRLMEEADVSQKSRLATTLLCALPALLVGIHGIHRLYLGKIGTGIVMLVLCILGWATVWLLVGLVVLIPVYVWTIIDFAFAVSGNMKDTEGKLIKKW